MADGESVRDDYVDIDEVEASMTRELKYYWSLGEILCSGTEFCLIYKVPEHIREADRSAYEPIILSVGPYHRGTPSLQAADKEKWNCLDYILKLNRGRRLLDYLQAVKEVEQQARNCYSEEVRMGRQQFLQMLLLDGCFVLVSLHGTTGIAPPAPQQQQQQGGEFAADENEQTGQWYTNYVMHDLLLLENQIPFFVVRRIYDVLAGKDAGAAAPAEGIVGYIEDVLSYYPRAIRRPDRPTEFHHLLHLCHMYFRPSPRPEHDECDRSGSAYFRRFLSFGRRYFRLCRRDDGSDEKSDCDGQQMDLLQASQQRWRRAAQYYEAGVEFRQKEFDAAEPHSLLDVEFRDGVVEVPCLPIDENTGSLFRNFVALEQTCPRFGNDFTTYVIFMSQLISTPEDVALLAQRGVVVHQLRSDKEVSTLFTKLSRDVVFDFNCRYYLKPIHRLVEAHYRSRLKRWMAWLRQKHFSNPWLGLAALAATVVLFCTAVQTLTAVFSYINPPN
ncbi:UPF0481 protein [Ananas comosus]|uniref:UPF0481 protein n=1 Tax=Ananas comosus TaxID=4615 RepID=A0A199VYB1_ANACO|nr:UPF0481 protein [Ananas comosus]